MKRRLFTLAAAVSMVLCIVTVGLWVRDDRLPNFIVVSGLGRGEVVTIDPGIRIDMPILTHHDEEANIILAVDRHIHFAGVHWVQATRYHMISIPYWIPVLILAIAPAWFLSRLATSNRRSNWGLCPTCGYDLRATPDRCPECGTVAVRAPNSPNFIHPNAIPLTTGRPRGPG